MRNARWSRRELLKHATLAAGAGLIPARLSAAPQDLADRKFLFVFCLGGWDPTYVFAPMFDSGFVAVDPKSSVATAGGLTYVDGFERPSVKRFFERYAAKTCIINGFEVRSVTHERCRRLMMTGKSQSNADDWPSQLAGSVDGYILPHLVISGPAYTSNYTTAVMRLGETGQLAGLLDGSALNTSETQARALAGASQTSADLFVRQRIEAFEAEAAKGRQRHFASDLHTAADQLDLVRNLQGLDLSVQLNGITPVHERVKPALSCLAGGYSRCAIVGHEGLFDIGWDNHSNIEQQSQHYEVLFADLLSIYEDMEGRTGVSGKPLSEEVVVVVCSEMGRGPTMNSTGGKDHWTFTSAMLIGPGVRGGQVLGAYDDTLLGRPMDLESGEPSDNGTLLSSENFGATLLAMADIDPGEAGPILAAFT